MNNHNEIEKQEVESEDLEMDEFVAVAGTEITQSEEMEAWILAQLHKGVSVLELAQQLDRESVRNALPRAILRHELSQRPVSVEAAGGLPLY